MICINKKGWVGSMFGGRGPQYMETVTLDDQQPIYQGAYYLKEYQQRMGPYREAFASDGFVTPESVAFSMLTLNQIEHDIYIHEKSLTPLDRLAEFMDEKINQLKKLL